MMHFVRTFSIMCYLKHKAYCFRRPKEAQNYEKIVYIINIFENGWWEDAYPSSYPSGHKLQKTSKESGMFQSLGTISFAFFY